MQWDNTLYAGFTTGQPWLPVNENYSATNVKAQNADENSVLNYIRTLINLRKKNKEVLVYGKYTLLDKNNPSVYAYAREADGKKFLVLLNFTAKESVAKTGIDISKAKLLIDNYSAASANGVLRPYEAAIFEL
jgi:oligo-1,6-glucosidase